MSDEPSTGRVPSPVVTIPPDTQQPAPQEPDASTRPKRAHAETTGATVAKRIDQFDKSNNPDRSTSEPTHDDVPPTAGQRQRSRASSVQPSTPNRPEKQSQLKSELKKTVSEDENEHEGSQDVTETVPHPKRTEKPDLEEDLSEDESEPAERIIDFDWEDLERRFQAEMNQKSKDEADIFAQYNELLKFFNIWMDVTSSHEVSRSTKRLKTRIVHVQNSENKLEGKRQHYNQVVQAFQSALQLLSQSS